MSELDKEIGKRLRKARKLSGYKSARSFAIEQKIPESTYSQHETGKRSLSPEIVLRYCECLQVDPGWLLSGRETGKTFLEVAEVSLNSSLRQKGYQSGDEVTAEEFMVADKSMLKKVFKEALEQCAELEISHEQLQEIVEYCVKNINAALQRTSAYSTKESASA